MVSLLFETRPSEVSPLVFPELAVLLAQAEVREPVVVCAGVSEDEAREREEAARVEGFEQGVAENEQRHRREIETERSAVQVVCSSFAQERTKYFAEAETEVVRLALAVARQVLQREVEADAAALRHVVRAALAKLGDVKGAVLRMRPEGVEAWREEMRHAGVEVVADDAMARGQLRLEAMGSVADLGIAEQMDEVERGFALLLKRPA